MPVIDATDEAPPGTSLYLLGFPLDQDLSISRGIISNQTSANNRWQTDTVMNPGDSGGPAFNENGALVGLAVAGVVEWKMGDQAVRVNGVNFIIPALTILRSPLFAVIQSLPTDNNCWTLWRNTKIAPGNEIQLGDLKVDLNSNLADLAKAVQAETQIPSKGPQINRMPYVSDISVDQLQLPDILTRTYTVSQTKDDHPIALAESSRQYERHFDAEPSYRIASCDWHPETANHSSGESCRINEAGTTANFSFTLTSGPAVDRWRGWLGGTLTLTQKHIQR